MKRKIIVQTEDGAEEVDNLDEAFKKMRKWVKNKA
jgi:hypothetical protein